MNKLQQKESGFSALEVLLVIVAVAIVAFASYYVYHAQKNANAALKTANNTATNDKLSYQAKSKSTQKGISSAAPNDTQVVGGYLVIKEWGVEMPVSSVISDAYYVKDLSDSNYQNMDLGTRSLTDLDKECAANATGPGYIGRETASIHDKNAAMSPEWDRPVYTTKIGNYYYGFVGPQATCSDKDTTNQKQAAAATAFSKASVGLKAVN